MTYPETLTHDVLTALVGEFSPEEVEFLPRAASGGMALGLPYIDARDVMRRLDAVVGPHNWHFDFDLLDGAGKMVRGKLTVLGVTKCDAGEASTEDEPLKSAVSDALKRCAVHFGVGRYLYYLPRVWAPFDAQKRRFIEAPRLDPAAVRRALALCGVGIRGQGSEVGDQQPVVSRQCEPPATKPTTENASRVSEPAAGAISGTVAETETAVTEVPAEAAAPRPTVVQGGAPASTAGRRSPWTAGAAEGTRSGSRSAAAERPNVGAAAPESSGDAAANVTPTCARPECGRSVTRGQAELSMRSFGKAYCPACQKLQARAA